MPTRQATPLKVISQQPLQRLAFAGQFRLHRGLRLCSSGLNRFVFRGLDLLLGLAQLLKLFARLVQFWLKLCQSLLRGEA